MGRRRPSQGTDPKILLLVLIVVVPLAVGAAGVASFLLLRAGYGPLIWGLVPFVVLVVLVGVLGVALGRAAGSRRDDRGPGE